MKWIVLLTLLLFWSAFLLAQDTDNFDLEDFIESNFPIQDDDTNYEDIYESLFQLYQSPINLNQATRQDLQSLFVLSNLQINSFLEYRTKNGKLLSIYELQAIPSFDLPTIRQILPFVQVDETVLQADNRPLLKRITSEKNNYLIIRSDRVLEQKEGFSTEDSSRAYLGDPNRLYLRYRVQHTNDFSIGFTAEKDAGEQLNWNPKNNQFGTDFFSAHFQLQNQGKLKNIIIGDYQLQFGQSLVYGAGFALGKGAETVATARRSNLGILPYTSVLETNFFRGAAATYKIFKNLDLTVLYSYNQLNANVQTDSIQSAEEFFTSIRLSGLHRTARELAAKNSITAQNFGGNLLFHTKSENLNIGLNYLQTIYDQPLLRNQSKYNQFEFEGKQNFVSTLFSNYYWRNFHLFGEAGLSQSGGIGAIGGLIASISNGLQMSVVLRNYERNFHTFYGTAFGENSRNINEKGIYLGLKKQFNRSFSIATYWDKFNFPWLKYQADAPSNGSEYLARLTYKFNKQLSAYAQLRVENKERNVDNTDNSNTYALASGQKRNYLINFDVRPKGILNLKTRLQFSEYLLQGEYSNGLALLQDVNFDWNRFKISTRYAIFDTDDFQNRQYLYEKDVLYAFSIPAYQNTGTRTYILAQYNVSKKIRLWARWAQFKYIDTESIGSGTEEIKGNTRSEVKFQIMLKF
ncbi:helix-hairpin-helix domain-containing protein [Marivirga atlantica]|jgi:hypothetical protein|uniref:Helix-hairpin-helix domain-containing protein n=1 Tax=Marivirga atlantica TaxID=1548457 RepID=A0A937DFI4_9BACT|nr:helix-hairpin-helix domain-containing protein [Marivirga atlantica]MBL0766247.1 helix-hairpin-helix domain-containing protein [Marivirga atlantica]